MTRLTVFLIISVLLAGCTVLPGQPADEDQQDAGLTVTGDTALSASFTPLRNAFQENEQLAFEMTVENTGEGTATQVAAELFGPGFFEGNCGGRQYSIGGTLRGVEQANNQEGARATHTWECDNVVDLTRGERRRYTARLWLGFDYTTTARATVQFVTRDEFDGSSQAVATDNTAGPLTVDVGMTTPTPLRGDGRTPINTNYQVYDIRIPITVRNTGEGKLIYNDAVDAPDIDEISVSLEGAGNVQGLSLNGCMGGGTTINSVAVFDGSRSFECSATVPTTMLRTDVPIVIDLQYNYEKELTAPFSIVGMAGDQTSGGSS